jgi:redox-sensitive bicupin YhaK (pirin superfamily)
MPAVTVSDPLRLPTLDSPDPAASVARPVRRITTAPNGHEGEGFPVRRAFAGIDLVDLDPFIHMDQMGEVLYGAGEPKGTPWHPHRGFETVTYLIDGEFEHRDSHGGGGLLRPGDTQWMTAGSGLLHIERPTEAVVATGGLFHGVQLWVNLPRAQKMTAPRYQHLAGGEVTLVRSPDGGAVVRLIAGALGGHAGPGATHTPITYAHATLSPGARLEVPWDPTWNALVYVLAGQGSVGVEAAPVRTGQLAVLGAGGHVVVQGTDAQDGPSDVLEVLLLGGRPIREPVAWHGPFVMNDRAGLVQAFEDFEAGRLGTVPADEAHRA